MRYRFAITWLLVIANSILRTDDWTSSPSTNFKLPRVLRAGHAQDLLPQDSPTRRSTSTFDLKTTIPANGDIVTFTGPITANRQYVEDTDDTSGVVEIQHTESFSDESFDRQEFVPPTAPRPLFEAVPLDSALRDDRPPKSEGSPRAALGWRNSLGWIAGSDDQLGMWELDFAPTSRVQYDASPSSSGILGVSYGAKWLSGPSLTDLPPQLFNVLIDVGQTFQVDDRLTIDAMISPGWYTDFSNKGIQAFRLPWHIVSYYKMFNDWRWVMGITDLGRDDIRYLPVIGMILENPESDLRLDLVFPRPRVAWRIGDWGEEKQWIFLGGELGGGSWAISRENRAYDVVTYRDYRLIAGLESRTITGTATRLEVGWVFDRSVQYRSDIGNYAPPDSLMVRISADY
jgi:hypothetical protein